MSFDNEFEERRIIRLLAAATRDVRPLAPEEVRALLRVATSATAGRNRRRSRRIPQLRRLLATAAAIVVGVGLGSSASESQRSSHKPVGPTASLVSFPEGTALHLLLSMSAGAAKS